MNGADYGSDDEVYALASAVDAADPHYYEEERSADKKAIDPLPPIDHSNIEYDGFVKDFYQEAAELSAMTPAEVSFHHQKHLLCKLHPAACAIQSPFLDMMPQCAACCSDGMTPQWRCCHCTLCSDAKTECCAEYVILNMLCR